MYLQHYISQQTSQSNLYFIALLSCTFIFQYVSHVYQNFDYKDMFSLFVSFLNYFRQTKHIYFLFRQKVLANCWVFYCYCRNKLFVFKKLVSWLIFDASGIPDIILFILSFIFVWKVVSVWRETLYFALFQLDVRSSPEYLFVLTAFWSILGYIWNIKLSAMLFWLL